MWRSMSGDTATNGTHEHGLLHYRNPFCILVKVKMLTDVFRFFSDYRQSFEFMAIQIVR